MSTREQEPSLSERRVRREARRIVEDLDRSVDNAYTFAGCLAFLAGLGLFPYCWKILGHPWWGAALWALGALIAGFVAAALVVMGIEHRSAQKAVRRFNLRFPETSPHRPIAEALLADVEPRHDAVTAFLQQVVSPRDEPPPSPSTPERSTRRTRERLREPAPMPSPPTLDPHNESIPLELPSPSK